MKHLLYLCCVSVVVNAGLAQNKPQTPPPSFSADQCTIGFYSRDSVAIKTEQGKPHYDAMAVCNTRLNDIREKQIPATDRLLTAQGDSAAAKTAEGKKKVDAAKKEVNQLRTDSLGEEKNIREHEAAMNPLFLIIAKVADSISRARGFKQVREAGDNSPMICPNDQMLMVDISNEVAIAMNLKPTLARIGTYNADSIMRFMPGYAKYADSTKAEMAEYNRILAEKNRVIDLKQHELDSLRPNLSKRQISTREKEILELQDDRDIFRGYELYKIEVRDSLRTKEYRLRFRKALATAVKSENCFRAYDEDVAQSLWTAKEAEFVDLNAFIVKQLGL